MSLTEKIHVGWAIGMTVFGALILSATIHGVQWDTWDLICFALAASGLLTCQWWNPPPRRS
jgi:hypothetical protein